MLAEWNWNLPGLQVWLSKKGGSPSFLKFTNLSLCYTGHCYPLCTFFKVWGFAYRNVWGRHFLKPCYSDKITVNYLDSISYTFIQCSFIFSKFSRRPHWIQGTSVGFEQNKKNSILWKKRTAFLGYPSPFYHPIYSMRSLNLLLIFKITFTRRNDPLTSCDLETNFQILLQPRRV